MREVVMSKLYYKLTNQNLFRTKNNNIFMRIRLLLFLNMLLILSFKIPVKLRFCRPSNFVRFKYLIKSRKHYLGF